MKMISLKQAETRLLEEGLPIRYATLYQWSRKGIWIEEKLTSIATQVGNRWFISGTTLENIINDIRAGKRIRLGTSQKKKTTPETRGRKKGTKFGTYQKCDGGRTASAHRLLLT